MEKFLLAPKAPGAFSSEVMYKVVLNSIDFELPQNIWDAIYDIFNYHWNVEVGYGNRPDINTAVVSVCYWSEKEDLLVSDDKIETIVKLMFDWVEHIPGVILDDKVAVETYSNEIKRQETKKRQQMLMQELSAEIAPAFNDTMTNFVYISDKLKEVYPRTYKRLIKLFNEMDIEWGEIEGTKDIWIRDYMPIQISDDRFIAYNYNPNYLKDSGKDYLTDSQSIYKSVLPEEMVKHVNIMLDGGNVVTCFWDRVMTDKVFQENVKLQGNLEFTQISLDSGIIILPWHCDNSNVPNADVYSHADCLVHWTGGNRVLMSNHREFAPDETDNIRWIFESDGYEVTEMLFDVPNPNKDFNWAYINYLEVDNKIIVPTFGIPEDKQAMSYIKAANPDSIVRGFRMRDIARNGRALHSITWNIKKSELPIEPEAKDPLLPIEHEIRDMELHFESSELPFEPEEKDSFLPF